MTTTTSEPNANETGRPPAIGGPAQAHPPRGKRRPRTRRQTVGVVVLLLAAAGFLAYSLPPYLGLDPSRARLPVPAGFPAYYPLLVTHIFCGSVALVTGCLQLWPWLRRRHPAVHRWSGRAYFFGGVLPAGVAILGVAPLSFTGVVGQVSNTMLAVLWLPFTIAGYRAARQRRYADHRRWMVRSFALTTSIVLNRVWLVVWIMVLMPRLSTQYGGDMDALVLDAGLVSGWMSWTVNLLVAEWWLQRGGRATRRARRARAVAA
ncbi:Predicted membrane protein [Actinopolymorpha cephalotaxi]|uniref:Predicted membrane protein n=1 Tax=Actinopolymorpha cephalotaxi TaxID=504797 RepID=A0A1I2PT27_9ACTN|nr:DUF2306 domain-containing protein [Actinopolymorpha cephalotaxi]NYH83515.1 uncharacterized membrane protein YozB (DUF420 family) [Actinopolymorpha cephalotaxi]SFG18259.1 Predicted membrane protein [Actinopolymorpha cephalotaxi]